MKLIDITGKAISGEWGNDCEDGNGIPVLRTTNFTDTGVINFANVVLRDIPTKDLSKKFLRPGDIIIEKSGGSDTKPVGRVVYFDSEENKYLINNFTGLLRVVDQTKWYPRYVFYALFANYSFGGTRQYENKTTGLHNLKLDQYLNSFDIPDVDFQLQHHIADTLDKVSEGIGLCGRMMDELDLMVKAKFGEMFGDAHNNSAFPYKNIGDLTTVTSGGTPDRENNLYWDDGNIRWVKTTELQNCTICDTEEKITKLGLENSSAKLVPAGSVLIAMYGQGKTRGMTAYLENESATNQACACILPSSKINQKYLWKYLMLSYDKLRSMAKGGNQPNLNIGIIKNFPVLYPPIELQNQYVEFVIYIDKSILTIKGILAKMEEMKLALMQKCFKEGKHGE
jgi:putative type I restriction-modification system specificity determinant